MQVLLGNDCFQCVSGDVYNPIQFPAFSDCLLLAEAVFCAAIYVEAVLWHTVQRFPRQFALYLTVIPVEHGEQKLVERYGGGDTSLCMKLQESVFVLDVLNQRIHNHKQRRTVINRLKHGPSPYWDMCKQPTKDQCVTGLKGKTNITKINNSLIYMWPGREFTQAVKSVIHPDKLGVCPCCHEVLHTLKIPV